MHLAPVLSCSLLFSFFFFFFTKSIELSQVVLSSFNAEKVVNQKEKTSKDFLIVCPKLDDSRGEFDCRNEFFITQVTVKNDVNYIGTCVLCEEWEEIWIKTGNCTPASMGLI